MQTYHNDQPITGQESSPDLLSRTTFADNLANILTVAPGSECMTVSLEGGWGDGKTSVINLIKNSLSKHKAVPVIIEYNPWLAGKAEAMVQDFLVQFASQLNIPDRPKEALNVAKELLAYSKLFSVAKLIPGAEPWASTIQSVFNRIGKASEKIGKLKELDSLGHKNKISEAIAKLEVSIVVIIDDIDRLPPDEAFQVIRLIKAVADFPSTAFLLAFDPVYLASSLERHGIEHSNQYIDKIVQLRIPLPLVSHQDFQKLANQELSKLSEKSLTHYFEDDQDRLGYLYHSYAKHLIRSPRELKRIFNHLRFVLIQTKGNVCFTDLYCLSVLAIKYQDIYRSLKDSPEYYIGCRFDSNANYGAPEEVVEKNKKRREKILTIVPEKDRYNIEGLLKELFPLIDRDGYSMFYGANYDECGRIASEKRLYTAMHYQIPTGYASDKDVKQFLKGALDRNAYLKKAIQEDFVERLFGLIYIYLKKQPKDKNIADALHAIYDEFLESKYLKAIEENEFSAFRFDPYRNILSFTLDHLEATSNKKGFFFGLLKNQHHLVIAAELCRLILIQQGVLDSDSSRITGKQWLQPDEAQAFVEQWSQKTQKSLHDGYLLSSIHASRVYHVFYWAAPNKLRTIFSQWIKEEGGVEKIATLIGRSGSDSTNGPFADVSEKKISKVLDYKTLKGLAVAELNKPNNQLTPFLKAVYLSIKTGNKYYLKNATKVDDDF